MNRIARAWVETIAVPFVCPICGGNVGGKVAPPSDKIPLIVERPRNGRIMRVMLHAGCQSACSEAELREIRP